MSATERINEAWLNDHPIPTPPKQERDPAPEVAYDWCLSYFEALHGPRGEQFWTPEIEAEFLQAYGFLSLFVNDQGGCR